MIDKLIREGESLRSEFKSSSMGGHYLTGENFEKWASKVVLYLETYYPNKAVTTKAIETHKRLGSDSISNYEYLIGTIKAVKEFEEEEAASSSEWSV
jgi:hypothetical protein